MFCSWQSEKKVIIGRGTKIGLKNDDYYCYANAVVQMIYHSTRLRAYFNQAAFNKDHFDDSATVHDFTSVPKESHNSLLFEDARRVMLILDEDNEKAEASTQ